MNTDKQIDEWEKFCQYGESLIASNIVSPNCLILHEGLDAQISRCFLVYQWLNTNSIFGKYKFLYSISFTLKGHRKYLIVK